MIDLLKFENDCTDRKLHGNKFYRVVPLYLSVLFSASVLGRGLETELVVLTRVHLSVISLVVLNLSVIDLAREPLVALYVNFASCILCLHSANLKC